MATIQSSGRMALEVSMLGTQTEDAAETLARHRLEEDIRRELMSELGAGIRIVAAEDDPEAPRMSVSLIRPERADVQSFASETKEKASEAMGAMLSLGLSQRSQEDQMAAIGVDRERYRERQKAYEDSLSDWGLFPKTAKRRRVQELGYAPLLFSGRYLLLDRRGTRGMGEGLFFGWETVKHMSPRAANEAPPTEAEVLRASAKGLARYLKAQWSKH
jgi:hypothetical protein